MARTIKRPDPAALSRVLEQKRGTLCEIILRLAWELGLTREEIRHLKWQDISAAEGLVRLPDRSIPMEDALAQCLEQRAFLCGRHTEYVVTGERGEAPMQAPSISRIVRTAFDAEKALEDISLKDLRYDFIIRKLARHPWSYVAKISGMAATTMYTIFSDYMPENPPAEPSPEPTVKPDEFFVWRIVKAEGNSPVAVALWMAWRHCMDSGEIIALTWDDLDLKMGLIRLPDREIRMDDMLRRMLRAVLAERTPEDDPHVLLTPKSRRPFDLSRISKAMRTAFIRSGAENLTFQDLICAARRNAVDTPIFLRLAERGVITRGEAAELLGIPPATAYARLRRLVESGDLVRVGSKYYLPGAVVAPEEQFAAVRDYLGRADFAYLQDLAGVLKLERRTCSYILKKWVDEGRLVRRGQQYRLPREGQP